MMTRFISVGLTNRTRILATTILVLGLILWGCGNGGIEGQNSPSIDIPETLHFGQDAEERDFEISNTGDGPLTITSIGVENDVGAAFSEPDDEWPDEITIEENDDIELTVDYDPGDDVEYYGRINLDHNDSDEDAPDTIDLEASGLGAELFVDPSPIEFPQTPEGSEDWQVAEILNIGDAALDIDDIYLSQGETSFSVSFFEDDGSDGFPSRDDDLTSPPDDLTLEDDDDNLFMRVTFHPEDEQPAQGTITIDHTQGETDVALSGNSGDTCLEVADGEELDFGPSAINDLNLQTLTMQNCSPDAELNIYNLSITDDGGGVFSLDDDDLPGALPGDQEVLDPGEAATALVGYTPTEETTDEGRLLIESDDAHEPNTEIDLTGNGVDAECPIAEVGGAVGQTGYNNPVYASNQEIVDLSSDGSSDPDGTDLSYEWTVLDRPSGSGSDIEPSPFEANPEIEIDIVGQFSIELTVTDEYGLTNCEPAILEIDATPTGEIHVQLTWEAPEVQEEHGGPDPTASIGTDLDIHYVHQDGSWGDNDSVYYLQTDQDWGQHGQADLDIDDLYGADPENITHTDPLNGGMYRIGVHYYCDNNFGAADATVRVYFGDSLYTEEQERLEATDHFWYMGNIDWDAADPTVMLQDSYEESMPSLSHCTQL